uniref:Uncharacterized protein n=1 Tax=Anguilla anguilla TaxID=7936 RepID=A0A0E9QEV3_ANGAN
MQATIIMQLAAK